MRAGMTVAVNRLRGRSGVAAEEMRRHNLGDVLERAHLTGGLTRSELTAQTGLNRSTIADLVRELSDLGLVEEGPPPHAVGPGRPSPTVRPRPEGAVTLAIEIAVDSVALATVGLGGRVYSERRVTRQRGASSPEEAVHRVATLAGPLLDKLPVGHAFVGVGVAVVGITRRADGFVHLAPNLGWRDVPLAALLRDALATDGLVFVANEADLGALGEYRRGHSGVANLVYVSGEAGVGTGVIVGGSPMLGSAGYAGEAGHTLINPGGRRCRCGAVGCWETEAGEAALLRKAGIPDDTERIAVLMARADAGEPGTLRAIADVRALAGARRRQPHQPVQPGGRRPRRDLPGAVPVPRALGPRVRDTAGAGRIPRRGRDPPQRSRARRSASRRRRARAVSGAGRPRRHPRPSPRRRADRARRAPEQPRGRLRVPVLAVPEETAP